MYMRLSVTLDFKVEDSPGAVTFLQRFFQSCFMVITCNGQEVCARGFLVTPPCWFPCTCHRSLLSGDRNAL
jgi:hypothetical protein